MALATVADYIAEARRLLQDSVSPHRYPDPQFLSALNIGLLEARKARPDLFLGRTQAVPDYASTTQAVEFDPMYRPALAYYVAARVLLADTESADEARAAAFMQKFYAQLGAAIA